VRVVRFAHEVERIARREPLDEILAALETDADDLRVKIVRIADRREPVALEIGRAIRKEFREKRRIGLRLRCSRCCAGIAARRFRTRTSARPRNVARYLRFDRRLVVTRFVVVVETCEKPLEGGFGGGRRREPAGLTRA
jgi:hypothetical protein